MTGEDQLASAAPVPDPGRARTRLVPDRLADCRGQAIVEFALILPLLLVLILVVIDFGRAFNDKNDVTSLVNQAARFAEVNACAPCTSANPNETIAQYVASTADNAGLASAIEFTFSCPDGAAAGDPLTVVATAPYDWLPYLVTSIGMPISTTLSSSVTVRIADAPDGSLYSGGGC